MWIREIDFPATLIDAHRGGRLVIFVGAGASRDKPASLPDFRALTAEIADEAREQAEDADLDNPDRFLGRLADRDVDVHRRVFDHINMPNSAPNRLHEALVDLALAGQPVRLVTTNYDLHLSNVLHDRGAACEEYVGPALPMGDDFTGLVYLHGNLRQEPRRLVVTDADFGRAYLRDVWATRFLERMFSSHTVLFVGYSHGDIVMRYLARALGPGASRYALTDRPDDPDWRALGINAVGYSVVDGSHSALVDAIERWASQASMGLLDHRQQIARFVSAPPSQVPEEESYLETVVADAHQVKLFADLARGEEWLSWVTTQPEFRRLFDPSAERTECGATLAYWFAEHFALNEELSDVALRVVRDAGGRIGSTLWSALGHCLHMTEAPRPDSFGPWLVMMVENAPEGVCDWLEYALLASRWPADQSTVLILFDFLTEPRMQVNPRLAGLPGSVGFDIRLRGSTDSNDEAWQQLFAPNLAEAAPTVIAMMDRHLRRAFQLLDMAGSARPPWDPTTFGRSAIEDHPQVRYRRSIDTLIDAARDCLETLLDARNPAAAGYLRVWADSELPILRRLAVHGWIHRTDVDASSKIAWLDGRGWLFERELRHETFRLIEVAMPSADSDVADALVARVNSGVCITAENGREYEQLTILGWIMRHSPTLKSAGDAFAALHAKNPEFVMPPHPDLRRPITVERVQPRPRMTSKDLHERISADVKKAIAELRQFENSGTFTEGPGWDDALAVLRQTIRENPSDGFAVLDSDGRDHSDIVTSVISGWSTAATDAMTAEKILEKLAELDLGELAEDISRLLADGGRADTNPTEWHQFPAARALAADLWSMVGSGPAVDEMEDWLGHAINHPAGRIAQFWLHAIAADWRAAGDTWTRLPQATRDQLEIMLTGDNERSAMAQVMFSSQVLFFFGADRQWCEAYVLPLLDWASPLRARRAWDGFLAWGRWNDQLLDAGLLTGYLETASRIREFREELRSQLCAHLAGVAVTSERDPLDWITTFTKAVEVEQRVDWMQNVAWILDDLPTDAVEHQWQGWMRRYWGNRLASIPFQMTDAEASSMASWVVYLSGASVAAGTALAIAHPAGFLRRSDVLRILATEKLDDAREEFARLIGHLLKGTQQPFWDCHYLDKIVPRLRSAAPSSDFTTIVEEAMRLGCSGAQRW